MIYMDKEEKSNFEEGLLLIKDVLKWAEVQDTTRLRRFLVENANIPLYTIGSGGNFSPIDYCAMLYETNMSMSKALTPLMMASISDETLKSSKILIYSGEGNGVDEKYIVKRAAEINPKGICAITRNNRKKNFVIDTLKSITNNWFVYNIPSQKKFIETVSTIADYGIIYKSFTNDNNFVNKLNINLNPNNCFTYGSRINGYTVPQLNQIKNYIVLYSGWSKPIAFDFESKMVECGIASVQLTDYRNFTHGRFIFLSRHFTESALVLFLTPREIEYANKLIINGKTFQGNKHLFPIDTPIITISTNLDSPLASIDLLIKMQVCFNEIAKSFNVEPCKPSNPKNIHKKVPRNMEYSNLKAMGPLKTNIGQTTRGTMNSVDLRKSIKYNPKKSIDELARINNVSSATIRKYIIEQKIDRRYDEKMCLYNSIRLVYMDDTTCDIPSIAKKLKMSETTVRKYIRMEKPEFKLAEGKNAMVHEHPTLIKIKEDIKLAVSRFPKVKAMLLKHPEYNSITIMEKLHLTNDRKGSTLFQIECFMKMKDFLFNIKNKEIEYIIN